MQINSKYPLCIDLDGTLIFNDLVRQSFLMYCSQSFFNFFRCIKWGIHGFSNIKHNISSHILIQPEKLHFNQKLIHWLNQNQNLSLYLVTGSPQKYANIIKNFLSNQIYFQDAFGSSAHNRLTGIQKAQFLKDRFKDFIYIGNSYVDRHIWDFSQMIIATNTSKRTEKWIKAQHKDFFFI